VARWGGWGGNLALKRKWGILPPSPHENASVKDLKIEYKVSHNFLFITGFKIKVKRNSKNIYTNVRYVDRIRYSHVKK